MEREPLNMEFEARLKHEEEIAYWSRFQRFRMFFAGLIFAIISFIGTHPISTQLKWLKISEILSLSFLLITGVILLLRASCIKYVQPVGMECYSKDSIFFNI